nr:hypothetical protein [Morchella crassipes]
MRNSLKRGGVAPLFISLFFFPPPWRCRMGAVKVGGKNLKMKICGERGGGFPTLDRRSRAFGVVVGGGMRKGRGGKVEKMTLCGSPPPLYFSFEERKRRTGGERGGERGGVCISWPFGPREDAYWDRNRVGLAPLTTYRDVVVTCYASREARGGTYKTSPMALRTRSAPSPARQVS